MKVQKVTFKSVGVTLVGDLYLPEEFNENNKHKAIVVTPPAHQIKEQTAAVYGALFAKLGFIFLAFDYTSKGESESYDTNFRNDENSFRKHEDLRNAISFLYSLPFVDKARLYGVGICGGANIMSSVLITDLRVRAFAAISGMLSSDQSFFLNNDALVHLITTANQARQRIFETNKPELFDLFGYEDPQYQEKNLQANKGRLEGYDYYGTKRAGTQTYARFSNYVLTNIYESAIINIGEQYAARMMQPFLAIVGEKAETAVSTEHFYQKVTSEKEFFVVPGATHVDLYDVKKYVNVVTEKIAQFFNNH